MRLSLRYRIRWSNRELNETKAQSDVNFLLMFCPEGQKQLANLPREEEGSVPSEDEDQTNGLNEGDLEDISQKITDISQKVTDNPNAPVNIPLAKLQGTELVKDEDDDVTSGSASQHGDEAEDDALPVDNQRADNALPSGEGKGQTSVKTKSRESVDHDVKSTFVSSSGASGSGELSDPVSGSGGGNSETDKNDSEEDDDDDDEDDDDDDDDNDDDSDYGDGGEEGEDRELSKRSAILTPETWGALASLVKHELSASTSGDDEDRDLEMLEDPDDSETDTDEEAESDPGPSPDSDEATDEDTKGTRQRSQIAHPEVTSGSDSDVTSGVEASGTGDSRDSSVESVVPRVSAQSSESGEGVTSGDHQADVTSPGHVTTKADDDVTPTSHATDSHVASKSTNEVASGSGSPSSGYQQDATSRSRVTNNDVTSGSAVEQIVSLGQEVQGEQEDNAHDIEDAIFDKGLPLTTSSGQASSSEQADQTLSRKKKPTFDTAEYRRRLDLIEKMMKAGKFRAFQVSHKPVRPSARDEVPHKSGDRIQSDVGKATRVRRTGEREWSERKSCVQ